MVSSSVRQPLVKVAAWGFFALIHVVALLFFAASAFGYWALRDRGVSNFLETYRLGIHRESYGVLAAVFACVALVHAWLLLQMVTLSVQEQRLVYNSPRVERGTLDSRSGLFPKMWRLLLLTYDSIFSPIGLLGVRGPCFDLLLLLREVVETALQTAQAYRMSQFLSRAWLNALYVTLLVANCWLLVIVHSLFHARPATRYFLSLLCDLALDFVSSIGVTLALVVIYVLELEPTDVFGAKWFDDAWLANATNEFHLILVESWADLALRLVFAVSMVSNLNLLKGFVSSTTEHIGGPRHRWGVIVPTSTASSARKRRSTAVDVLAGVNHVVRAHPVLTKLQRVVFAAWGAAVVALHVATAFSSQLPQCVMQVRPWGISRPSCNLVLIDCHREGITGQAGELDQRLASLHAPSVGSLTVRHCASLEMTPIIQAFVNLHSVRLYNTTVTRWDADAALTAALHPALISINLHRVSLPDGLLPRGLLSPDFSSDCNIFSFVDTNLRNLPGDLDSRWPHGKLIDLANANLTKVPGALLRLRPRALLLEANPIEHVPQALFELSELVSLDLRDTGVSLLPTNLTTLPSKLTSINLDGTAISSFPEWVDAWLEFPGDLRFSERISAAGTPYCVERERIFAGKQAAFSFSSGSRLMDATPSNWEYLRRSVACTRTAMYRYPIELEDGFSALP